MPGSVARKATRRCDPEMLELDVRNVFQQRFLLRLLRFLLRFLLHLLARC